MKNYLNKGLLINVQKKLEYFKEKHIVIKYLEVIPNQWIIA